MKLDEITLKDLEIFSSNESSKTIFSIFDKTKTRAGKLKLKKRFISSNLNRDDIRKNQELFKYIISIADKLQLKTSEDNIKLIEDYMVSNMVPVYFNNKLIMGFEGLLYKLNYPDFFVFFSKGVFEVISFLQGLNNIFTLKNESFPELLNPIFENIDLNLKDSIIKTLIKSDPYNLSYIEIFHYDKLIRENLSKNIRELIDLYCELDSLISIALVAKEYDLNFPEFVDTKESYFQVEELYHLFISKPKTNNFSFENNINLLFLTGPNMAGKTTFLKSCGVILFLAHLGLPVPAKKVKTSYFDSIFTSINVTDNLNKGYSYYYSEVLRVKESAIKLSNKEKVFVIFDELFKGTNVDEAYLGASMVIKGFTKHKGSFFIISSHLAELEKDLKDLDSVSFSYFDSVVDRNNFSYDYKLKKGLSRQKLGIFILEKEGIFDLLNN